MVVTRGNADPSMKGVGERGANVDQGKGNLKKGQFDAYSSSGWKEEGQYNRQNQLIIKEKKKKGKETKKFLVRQKTRVRGKKDKKKRKNVLEEGQTGKWPLAKNDTTMKKGGVFYISQKTTPYKAKTVTEIEKPSKEGT